MTPETALLSVVVSTRNRPEDLSQCVATILASQGAPPFELLIVDQSDDERSRVALAPFLADPRLRYVVTPTRGLSRSRNVAVEMARGEALLFTDDDCRVPAHWMAGAWAAIQRDPQAAMVFGRVTAPGGLPADAFVATFEPSAEGVFDGRAPSPMRPWGIGANMLIRRRAFEAVGRFDPVLSCVDGLRAAEETDFLLRVLGAGLRLRETASFEVLHLGVRSGAAAGALFETYAAATGAAYAKNLRLGTPGVPRLAAHWFFATCWRMVFNLFFMGRPRGAKYMLNFFRGARRSLRYKLDRRAGCMLPQD